MNYGKEVEEIKSVLNKNGWSTNVEYVDFHAKPKQTLREIQNIFFGLSEGNLPDEINLLKNEYLQEKKSLGSGCKKCVLTALINRYKKKVTNIVNNL